MNKREYNLTGQKFNYLQVVKLDHIDNRHNKIWLCKCDCGNYTTARTSQLNNGSKKSCGCLIKEKAKKRMTTHSLSRSRIYRTYTNMIRRCTSPIEIGYENYGGRGIQVCDEWLNDFMNFYNWAMGNGYNDNLTIDRIDNDGDYEPSNCRWVTMKKQCRNKSNNRVICIEGVEKSLIEWAEYSGISYDVLKKRVQLNWKPEELLKPVRYRSPNKDKF